MSFIINQIIATHLLYQLRAFMKKAILFIVVTSLLLTSCYSPIPPETTLSNTPHPSHTPTQKTVPTVTSTPTSTITKTVTPWTQLERDSIGDYIYRCTITDFSFAIIEILPGIEAQGFLLCGDYQIPVGIYDKNENKLFYWGLNPVQDPTILDHLGERAFEYFVSIFGLGKTYLDSKNVIGKELSMSINIPNSVNKRVFDTQNFGKYAGDYWVNQDNVDNFAVTGILPNEENILYPISLGLVK
ncbi:MAG: hypothetical protein CVU42_06890 [Chloroflexi bacterium HGW-Chloroflexi-4]|jgi:hypothetical protein|nr:MAG: hypothetical protein CVU42_06890 [Chloroflexi bacterium HGW-Chloroflexi-4]